MYATLPSAPMTWPEALPEPFSVAAASLESKEPANPDRETLTNSAVARFVSPRATPAHV
jgi:hypothetical protein